MIGVSLRLSDTAYVRIFVTDVNDNAPAFPRPQYELSVEEDQEVGFTLLTVTANDEDEGETDCASSPLSSSALLSPLSSF